MRPGSVTQADLFGHNGPDDMWPETIQVSNKLPKAAGNMAISQGILLEILHLCIESGTVAETMAIKRYEKLLEERMDWFRGRKT